MKKRAGIVAVVALLVAVVVCFVIFISIQNEKDKIFLQANDSRVSGKYDEAESLLKKIPNYNGASDLLLQVIYERGCSLFEEGKEAQAEEDFQKIKDYQNAKEYLNKIAIHRAESYMEKQQYEEASAALKNVSQTDEIISFQDKLYRAWGQYSAANQSYAAAYQALRKIKNLSDEDKELLRKNTVYYARELLNSGKPDEAQHMIKDLEQLDDVVHLQQEINDTRLAVTCIQELQGRYTKEVVIGELLEVRCAEQDYRGNIQIPIVMIRFTEKNVTTGQVQEAYAIYDNDKYMYVCHSLNKDSVDMKNAIELDGYLKLSKNWDTVTTITLDLNGIKHQLQM